LQKRRSSAANSSYSARRMPLMSVAHISGTSVKSSCCTGGASRLLRTQLA
jgi:hypothetical protein